MDDKFEFPVIETERLLLKGLTLEEEDIKRVFKHFSDSQVTRFMDIDACKHISEAEEIVRFHVEDSGCRWGLYKKVDNKFIGTCGFHCWDKKNSIAEIGYDLGKAFWGRGMMYEALQSIIKFSFDSMGLTKIYATVEVDNERSVKLLRRLDFKREEELTDGLIYFYLTKD